MSSLLKIYHVFRYFVYLVREVLLSIVEMFFNDIESNITKFHHSHSIENVLSIVRFALSIITVFVMF